MLATSSPTSGGPASSAIATGSSTPAPSGAWRGRPRSSSSPRTTSGHGSPMRSRWLRSPPPSPAPAVSTWRSPRRSRSGMTVVTGRGARQRGRARSVRPRRIRPRPVGRVRVPHPAEPLSRDHRRDRQPQLVAPRSRRHPRARWSAGRTGWPTCATTGRTRSSRASWRPISCLHRSASAAARAGAPSSARSSTVWSRPRLRTGQVGMEEDTAEALAAFRACNYERIYLREASVRQGHAVVQVLRALVEHFSDRPHLVAEPGAGGPADVMAGQRRGRQRRRHLCGRHDRPLRFPPGGGAPRMGPGQAARRRGRLRPSRVSAGRRRSVRVAEVRRSFLTERGHPLGEVRLLHHHGHPRRRILDRRRHVAMEITVELQLGGGEGRRRDLGGEPVCVPRPCSRPARRAGGRG